MASGDSSPVELVEAALSELERVEITTNAFTHVLADHAVDEARRRAASPPVGTLHGVPVVVKELFDIVGTPTTGCCAAFEGRIALTDSAVVHRLRTAGAIIIAKSNQHEMACGATNLLSSFGPVRNPWDGTRIAGGSSGGSAAAVAGGVVSVALGSDTGGSVRIPASFCGVTALKTTHGAVSLRGAMPLVPTLDTAGPIGTCAEDCRVVLEAIAGYDPADVWSRRRRPWEVVAGLEGQRISILQRFQALASSEVRSAVTDAARTFEALGAVVDEIDEPDPDEAWDVVGPVFVTEFAAHYPELANDERAHPEVRALVEEGTRVSGTHYARSIEACRVARRRFDAALGRADFLLAPTTPFSAPRADETEVDIGGRTVDVRSGGPARLTMPINVAGLPAVSLPVGFSSDGMPVGAQLIGPSWSEPALCEVASRFQEATDWHRRRPSGSLPEAGQTTLTS